MALGSRVGSGGFGIDGLRCGGGGFGLLILALDLVHVGNGFAERRDIAVFLDVVGARIIRGERERQVVAVELQ